MSPYPSSLFSSCPRCIVYLQLQNREYREEDTLNRIACVTIKDVEDMIPTVLDESQMCASFVGRVEHQRDALLQSLK